MITIKPLASMGIIVVEPDGLLGQQDFQRLAHAIANFPTEAGTLVGLVIRTKSFPGWKDLSAFTNHVKFVKEPHRDLRRVAIVTESLAGEIGPALLARHFIPAEISHFPFDRFEEARLWAQKGGVH